MEISKIARTQCQKEYPHHLPKINQCLDCLYDPMIDPKKDLKRLVKWISKMSDIIEIELFGIQSKDWRNPFALEVEIMKWLGEAFHEMLKLTPIREEILKDLRQQEFYNTEMGLLMEKLLMTGFCSHLELTKALDVSEDSMKNQIDVMIESGQLKKRSDKK